MNRRMDELKDKYIDESRGKTIHRQLINNR